MKTILPFTLAVFLLVACKNSTDSPSSSAGKKTKKHTFKEKPVKSSPSAVSEAKESSFSGLENEILFHVNRYRRSKGLPVLQMNSVITAEAEGHSTNMATRRTGFSHAGFSTRVRNISTQLGGVHQSAENVAYGYLSAKEVVNGWLHSPGHKKNIEGKYKLTGIGVAKDRTGTLFFTQLFVTR